ncbi:MAG: DUF4974 domain-containing protein [Cyclobacteriaceae bacterium]
MSQPDYFLLIHKSLTHTITLEENQALTDWLASSPDNQDLFEQVSLVWHGEWNDEIFTSITEDFHVQRARLINTLQHTKKQEGVVERQRLIAATFIGIFTVCLITLMAFSQLKDPTGNPTLLQFQNVGLQNISEKLEHHFNAQVKIVNPALHPTTFTGTFLNQEMEEILKTISDIMGFTYEVREGVYYIKGKDESLS